MRPNLPTTSTTPPALPSRTKLATFVSLAILSMTACAADSNDPDPELARADEYASNRMVCGVHYRSDIQAAKLLAYAVHAVMLEDPQFKTEVSAARGEARELLCTGTCKK